MPQLRTIFLILTTTVVAAAVANAQVTSGTAGIVTTIGSGTTGVSASATSTYPDVAVTIPTTTSTSGFHIFNSSSELLRVQSSNGFVGIGTATPQVLLDLYGDNASGGGQIRLQAHDYDQITFYNASTPAALGNRLAGIYYDVVNNKFYIENTVGNKSLILNSTTGGGGNVGIGTTSPSAKLHVLGSTLLEGVVGGGTTPAITLDIKANNILGAGQIRLQSTDYDQITFYNSNSPDFANGSWTTNRLGGIYYDVVNGGLYIGSNSGHKYLVLNADTDTPGSVGIAATAPTGKLQIGSTSPARFEDMVAVNGAPGVLLNMTADSEIHIANMQIGTMTRPVIQTPATGQSLYLNPDYDNNVVIGSSGHGGSGLVVASTGPSSFAGPLTVNNSITATTVYANYQDVAEWVPAAASMPAGTVVVISDNTNNTVTTSTRAYDTGVAGVVSPNPGLLLGAASPSKAKIATTGRVKVRVDASKQPIRMGDLLVTSDRPGMAMKSEPLDVGGAKIHRPGTLIGKALEPLPRGEGEILVLLSLQ